MLNAVLKLKKQIVTMLALSILLVAAFIVLSPQIVTTTLGIQFENIEKGLNPDGTRFDFNDLRNEAVIKRVCSLSGVGYTPELRDAIEIKPILPKGIVNHIKSKRIKGEAYTYFPSEFQVRIKSGFVGGIPVWDALKLSQNYYQGYAAYFKETYQFPYVSLTQLVKEYQKTDYDYPEIAQVYENQFNILISYLTVLDIEDPLFLTKEGYTFKDLIASLKITQELDLDQISALVRNANLTKDKAQLILKYQYMLKRYAFEQQKDQKDYASSSELLAILKAKEKGMVIPDVNGVPVTITALDDSYDGLAQKANESQVQAGLRNADSIYLTQQIGRLNGQVSEQAMMNSAQKEVDHLITQLNGKMDTWIGTIERASNEYFVYKYGKAVTLHKSAAISGLGVKRLAVLIMLIWIFLCCVVFFRAYYKNRISITELRKKIVFAINNIQKKPEIS